MSMASLPEIRLAVPSYALTPPSPSEYEPLRQLEIRGLGSSWIWRGETPSPEAYAARMWLGVVARFTVVRIRDGQPLGIVIASNADFEAGHLEVSVGSFSSSPLMIRGAARFISYCLCTWGLRRVFFRVPSFNEEKIGGFLGRWTQLNGRLPEYISHRGEVHALSIYSLSSDIWLGSSMHRSVLNEQRTPSPPVRNST